MTPNLLEILYEIAFVEITRDEAEQDVCAPIEHPYPSDEKEYREKQVEVIHNELERDGNGVFDEEEDPQKVPESCESAQWDLRCSWASGSKLRSE